MYPKIFKMTIDNLKFKLIETYSSCTTGDKIFSISIKDKKTNKKYLFRYVIDTNDFKKLYYIDSVTKDIIKEIKRDNLMLLNLTNKFIDLYCITINKF